MPRPPSASYKSRDRGPVEFESELHEKTGNIMKIARGDVVTISPGLPIKEVSEIMAQREIRRLPVTSPGTEKLHGMVVSRDIVDFLGGGEKHKIIQNKHGGNFLSAINDRTELIMDEDPHFAKTSNSIREIAKLLHETGAGGVPVLDKKESVVGIVTERDYANYMPAPAQLRVEGHMSNDLVTAEPDLFLIDAIERMISEGFRRLPVVEDGELSGIITSVDVLKYFASSEVFEHMSSGDASDAMSIETRKIMTDDPITTTPDADLGEVARKMDEFGYGGLPVLEDDGTLVGLITERDVLEILL